jgi:hypothetical protein
MLFHVKQFHFSSYGYVYNEHVIVSSVTIISFQAARAKASYPYYEVQFAQQRQVRKQQELRQVQQRELDRLRRTNLNFNQQLRYFLRLSEGFKVDYAY